MRVFKFIMAFAVIGALLTYSGCAPDPDPGPSPQDQQVAKLSKTWKVSSTTPPTLGGSPQSGYTNFQLVINGTAGQTSFGFTTSGFSPPSPGAKSPWPSSGTFTFGTDFGTTLIRDDGSLPVTYAVTDTQLQMTFNYQGPGFGRIDNVGGNWVFTFVP